MKVDLISDKNSAAKIVTHLHTYLENAIIALKEKQARLKQVADNKSDTDYASFCVQQDEKIENNLRFITYKLTGKRIVFYDD